MYSSVAPFTRSPIKHDSTSTSSSSDASDHSRSTAPTVYSQYPVLKEFETSSDIYTVDARDSTSTYASTIPSVDDLPEESPLEVVQDRHESFPSNVLPSNPAIFADLFPSARRLLIRHDDSTTDGNMNLRVDTLTPEGERHQQQVTLFHLRMHDLHSRKFSFRRYCRDSGREICNSRRKINQAARSRRPSLQPSLSGIFSLLRSGSSGGSSVSSRRNSDFKPGALAGMESFDEHSPTQLRSSLRLSSTILLEFSNYAHVEVRRRTANLGKQYEFEYFSHRYQWRRTIHKDGASREVSFHLVDLDTSKSVAQILPEILTPLEALEEESKGGWVPPCSMWMSDPLVYEKMADVADVIVATGLMALVDDSIRRRWHKKRRLFPSFQNLPTNVTITKSVDAAMPIKFIEDIFHRRGSTS